MEYPPGFAGAVSAPERILRTLARSMSTLGNVLVPGKKEATALLVANERTQAALPRSLARRPVVHMVENGVDLSLFKARHSKPASSSRFIFVGRLVDWKRLDLLLEALSLSPAGFTLDVVGDGPMRGTWEKLSEDLDLGDRVRFHGFLPQRECAPLMVLCAALVLPSISSVGERWCWKPWRPVCLWWLRPGEVRWITSFTRRPVSWCFRRVRHRSSQVSPTRCACWRRTRGAPLLWARPVELGWRRTSTGIVRLTASCRSTPRPRPRQPPGDH